MKINNLKRTKDGVVRAELSDGTALRISDSTVIELKLFAGMELDGELWERLKAAADWDGFRMKALRMASGRLISRREAVKKLREKGCDDEQAEEIARWLVELGVVNDALLGENLVRHYSAKGYGKAGIKRELQRRGIDRETAELLLKDCEPDSDAIDRLVQARLKGKTPDKKELQRVAQALMRRGHGWGEIKDALRRYEQEPEEDI